jgi:RHS repeat-associated protein
MKTVYRIIIAVLLGSMNIINAVSQTTLILDSTTASGKYIARDWIELQSGFSFTTSAPTPVITKIVEVIWNYSSANNGWWPYININSQTILGSSLPEGHTFYNFIEALDSLKSNFTSAFTSGWTINSTVYFTEQYVKIRIEHASNFIIGDYYNYNNLLQVQNYSPATDGTFEASSDDGIVIDAAYLDSQPDINRSLDKSLQVGSLPGIVDVSPTGAATYSMPIDVLPGAMGMQPQISVVYNSMAGNGLLGMGFDLAGLSSITRAQKTKYSNDTVSGITLTYSDIFALDGNKLVLTNGTYGANNSTYSTENETFSRITSYGIAGNGPEWFKVETKDGRILEYGKESDSRLEPSGSTTVLMWKLNKVTDPNGNYMTFKYKKENNESVIFKIEYTGNGTTLSPFNSVDFIYDKKSDSRKLYISDKYIMQSLILSSIRIKSQDKLVRQYNFNYTKDVFTHLSEVVLMNSEEEKLNSTIFNWGEYNKTLSVSQYVKNYFSNYEPEGDVLTTAGDINGDGLDDLLRVYQYKDEYGNGYTAVQPCISILNDDGTLEINANSPYFMDPDIITSDETGSYHSLSAVHNMDGDHIPDIVIPTFSEPIHTLFWYVPNRSTHVQFWSNPLLSTTETMPPYSINDINNDGLDDIIIVEKNGDHQKLSIDINHGGGAGILISKSIFSGSNNAPQRVFIADFNADGLNDVCIKSQNNVRFFKNTGGDIASNYSGSITESSDQAFFEPGDFNGDGLMDFIVSNKGSNPFWRMLINNGDWTFTTVPLNITVESTGNRNDRLKVMDFNNDGKSDIIIGVFENLYPINVFKVLWLKSTGNNMAYDKLLMFLSVDAKKEFIIGDFNGDARADLIYDGLDCYNYSSTESPRIYYSPNNTSDEGLLKASLDGYNNKTELSYLPLTRRKTPANQNFYTGYVSGVLPLLVVQPPIYCVWKITSLNGNDTTNTTEYSYDEARVHFQGLGFLGFHQITAKNNMLNRTIVTTNTLNAYRLSKQETLISTVTTPVTNISSNTINYSTVKQGSNYFTYVDSTNQVDISNFSINASFTYEKTGANFNGNILSELKKYDNNDNFYVKTEYAQYTTAGSYLLNKPKLLTITQKHPDDANPFISKVYNNYDVATGGLLSTISNYQVNGKEVTTTNSSFNALGQPAKVITSATGLQNIVKRYHYNARGQVDQEIDTLGRTCYEYDPVFGTNIKTTDTTGFFNQNIYDNWGTLIKSIPSDSLSSTQQIMWADGGPENSLYYSYTTKIGRPWSKTWYDSRGKVLREESVGFNNIGVYSDYTYTPSGQILKKISYMGATVTSQIDYIYYNDGRLLSETYLGGKTINYEYLNNLVKTTTDGKLYQKTYDSWGNVSSVIEPEPGPGGTITYKYYSNGKPWKIISPANTTISMTYDEIGNQKTLVDPDAGTINYTYDAYGRLTYQKDYKGNEDSIYYDYAGRIDYKKNKLKHKIDYQYVASGNGIGRIEKVIDQNNNSFQKYEYDALGRVKKTTQHIDATISDIIFEYEYVKGNVTKIKYPGNYIIDQQYDIYGNLKSVKNGSTAIWTLDQLTADKMKYFLGVNGMFTEKTYNSSILISSITKCGATEVQSQYYDFNPVNGLLRSREDRRTGYLLKEEFQYDGLNRLTNWNVSQNGTVIRNNSQTYSPDTSNITLKSSIGIYKYGTPRTHAIDKLLTNSDAPEIHEQTIGYTNFNKVASITENNYLYTITYGPDRERIKSELKQNNSLIRTNYYGGLYEKVVVQGGETKEILYITGGDGLAAVYVKSSTTGNNLYFAHKDHLGSIVSITNATGGDKKEFNYDPWGRRRNPSTWDYANVTFSTLLNRGFTGHEHLNEFTLINMNGRVYDPILGMFLSPDNYVQAPDFSQNFNRYSYCLNNPLKYTDPSGEKWKWWHLGVLDFLTGGMISMGATTMATHEIVFSFADALGQSYINSFFDNNRANNTWEIWGGIFQTDSHLSTSDRLKQLLSRFTWEAPQNQLGYSYTQWKNDFGKVDRVDYLGGATFATEYTNETGDGVTLGSFINIRNDNEIEGDFTEYVISHPLYMHEFGHTKDSRRLGPIYLFAVGLPSLISAGNPEDVDGEPDGVTTHDFRVYEMRANRYAADYFGKYYGVNWSTLYRSGTIETYYPRKKR